MGAIKVNVIKSKKKWNLGCCW